MIKFQHGRDFTKKSFIIKKEEDKLVASIHKKIDNFIKLKQVNRYKVFSLNTFNPLTTHLYFKVSFKFMKQFLCKILLINENLFLLKLNKNLATYIDTIKDKKIHDHHMISGQEEENNLFLKKHKIGSLNKDKKSGFNLNRDFTEGELENNNKSKTYYNNSNEEKNSSEKYELEISNSDKFVNEEKKKLQFFEYRKKHAAEYDEKNESLSKGNMYIFNKEDKL